MTNNVSLQFFNTNLVLPLSDPQGHGKSGGRAKYHAQYDVHSPCPLPPLNVNLIPTPYLCRLLLRARVTACEHEKMCGQLLRKSNFESESNSVIFCASAFFS